MYKIVLEPKPDTSAMRRDNWGEFQTLFDTIRYIVEELVPYGYRDTYIIQIVDVNTEDVLLFDNFIKIFS